MQVAIFLCVYSVDISSLLVDTNSWYCLNAIIILIIIIIIIITVVIVIVCNIHQMFNSDSKCHNSAIWSAADEACHLHVCYTKCTICCVGDITFFFTNFVLFNFYLCVSISFWGLKCEQKG